jgi:hypothetical protein
VSRRINLIGFRYPGSKLQVISFAGMSKRGQCLWMARCDCDGNVREYASYSLAKGKTKSCGCLRRQVCAEINRNPPGVSVMNKLYDAHKRHAKKNRFDPLGFAEWLRTVEKDCIYCGAKPSVHKHRRYKTGFLCNGVDRVDNSSGYPGNSVPCCWTCNCIKSDASLDQLDRFCRGWMRFRVRELSAISENPIERLAA